MSKTELIIPQNQAQQLLKFALYVAKLEEGCAPSVGFMIDIIKKAKAAVGDSSQADDIIRVDFEPNLKSDLEALIHLNISENFKAAPKNLVQKMALDIRNQFELTYKKQ